MTRGLVGIKLMFPISVEETLNIWTDSEDTSLDRIKDAIAAKGAMLIKRRSEELAFIGRVYLPVTKIWNPNPLWMFDRCVVLAQHEKLLYKCSTKFALILVTAMAILVWFAMWTASQPSIPLPIVLTFPPFMWLLVFGFNYVTARNRLRRFLEDVVWGPETSKR